MALSKLHILLISLAYLGLLFAIAYLGDRIKERVIRRIKPALVGLGVTIYCSAWSFYGVTAQAANNGWYFPPTFLGSIILVLCFAPLIKKLIRQSKHNNITSIADYLAVSYGHSRSLAVLITVVSMALLVPYISLQLKAIIDSYQLISQPGEPQNPWWDSALWVALILGVFAIAFGTRHLDAREHHNGLLLAIAFESLIKLAAFMVLAGFVAFTMFDGIEDILLNAAQNPVIAEHIHARQGVHHGYLTALVLGMIATICLPRQFHVMVVESDSTREFETVRWLFPAYLILFGACTLPLAYAGLVLFQGQGVSADDYVLRLPLLAERTDLLLLTYIGGLSAGSSMVIVACVAMATMACNELVVPLLLRTRWANAQNSGDVSHVIRTIRRAIIMALMVLAYVYYQFLANETALGAIGLLAFALVAQFAPSLLMSLWLSAHRRAHLAPAAIVGITTGFCVWVYTLLLPSMVRAGVFDPQLLLNGLFNIEWLRPTALLGVDFGNELSHGVIWSLAANIVGFLVVLWGRRRLANQTESPPRRVPAARLHHLLSRFLGAEQTALALNTFPQLKASSGAVGDKEIRAVENLLSGVIGTVSARQVVARALDNAHDDETLIEQTSELFQFSRELLQNSIDSIGQGISVVDAKLQLVAWNKRYLDIFRFPDGMVHVGRPVADLIRYNAVKKNMDDGEITRYVNKRLQLMQDGSPYRHTYPIDTARVLEIQGAPMGGGGFVTTFTDITDYQHALQALEEARDTLEIRVRERTDELQMTNRQLQRANQNKTHFLAAAGHDLIQPLHAAKLFVAALGQRQFDSDTRKTLEHLEQALQSADAIISELLAIAKLDSGEMQVNRQHFCVGDLLAGLGREFTIIADKQALGFRVQRSSLIIYTDEKLLKRILQNLLSNAIRYTDKGRVVIGCRRRDQHCWVEVWDTGCGIPESEQEAIFTEFHRLGAARQDGGLGLGLATVRRLCKLLDVRIEVNSHLARGSVFRVQLPIGDAAQVAKVADLGPVYKQGSGLEKFRVLCIDNDRSIRQGMTEILSEWGCEVHVDSVLQPDTIPWLPDILLMDYHLDENENGVALASRWIASLQNSVPVIIISADRNNEVRKEARDKGYFFLPKPVKVPALWSLLVHVRG